MAGWQGRLTATLSKYLKGKVDAFERKSPLWALMKSDGRMVYGGSGNKIEWNMQVKLPTTSVYTDMQTRTFVRHDLLKRLTLDYIAYDCTGAVSKLDMLANRGNEQMTNLLQTEVDGIAKSMENKLLADFYYDIADDANRLAGFGSWENVGSSLSNGVFNGSGTYAGLSTVLGDLGGSAPTSGTWPNGVTETPQYDAHTPLHLSSTSTAFGASATWEANALNILRNAVLWASKNSRGEGKPTLFVTTQDYMSKLFALLEARERLSIQSATPKLAKFGFNTITYYGLECVDDYWCPAATGHGLNMDALELHSMQPDVFSPLEKKDSEIDKTTRFGMDFFGQLKSSTIRGHFDVAERGS